MPPKSSSQSKAPPDGGDENHPIHDDDPSEDFTPRDYEEQIDEVADSRKDQRKRANVEEK